MKKTLAELANLVNGEVIGDKDFVIEGVSSIQEAKEKDLTFISEPKYIPLIQQSKASAFIVSRDIDIPGKKIIKTDNPSLAFTQILTLISEEDNVHPKGIHETAIISPKVILGKNVRIGPYVVIEGDVVIGDNTVIYSGTFVGRNAIIGSDCLIYSNVTIRERVDIGNRVIVHSSTVIGSDGFGFIPVKGVHKKIPQIGIVVIEDDVEIGANVTIDRARLDKTIIGQGTKIDNLVQIGHNVIIGKNCIFVSQSGVSGSSIIEDGVILAGQVGVAGHLKIGKGAVVAAQSAVMKNVSAKEKVSGSPARPYMQAKRVLALTQKLPQYMQKIRDLEKKVEKLERQTKNN